ncbi:MAG: trypsin-like serine protease [Gammaproteobacteria bacterium]
MAALLPGLLVAGRSVAVAHGEPPTDAEFAADSPWAVVLVHDDGPAICTGSLISPRFVLTAAHCVGDGLTVLYGNRSRESARRVAVREAIRHPKYISQPNAYDLGLLRLARPLRLRPLPIASRAETWTLLRPGGAATILGWGSTDTGEVRPDILRKATIRFADLRIIGTHIVYSAPRGGPCDGDSGGPLLMNGYEGQPLVVGVASVTEGNLCATGGGWAGYTDVPAQIDFIRDHVRDLPERLPPLDFVGL